MSSKDINLPFYLKPKTEQTKIQGGTLFDCIFVINKDLSAKQRMNFVLQKYLEGLLNLIEQHKTKPELIIKGTSYILNQRIAKKLRFKVVQTNFIQYFILVYNYFNLTFSNSIIKRKIIFPKIF